MSRRGRRRRRRRRYRGRSTVRRPSSKFPVGIALYIAFAFLVFIVVLISTAAGAI